MSGLLKMGAAVALLLLGGCFAYPIGNFLLLPLFPGLNPLPAGLGAATGTIPLDAVLNTVRLGLEVGLVVMSIGLGLGFLLERRDWRGNRLLAGCIWMLFLMPSYLLTDGWQILFAMPPLREGRLHRLFYSDAGIVSMFVLKGLPFAVFAARAGWAGIGGEIGAVLRIHVRDKSRQWRIAARLMMPSAGAMFAVGFIEAIQDFGISATLGAQLHRPLVIYVIYRRLSTMPVDFVSAASASWVLVLLAAAAVLVHGRLSRHIARTVHGRRQALPRPSCTRWGNGVAWLCTGTLATAGIGVPVLALLDQALGPQDREPAAGRLDPEDWHSLFYSLFYAALAGLAALLIACALVAAMRAGRGRSVTGRLMAWLTLGNMAVPGVVLGASYVIAFNHDLLPLYGTPLLLVLAYVATHLPMLIRFLRAPIGQLHAGLGDAARLHGMSRLARIEQIHLPLLIRPLIWGWAMSFASVFFELPLSELLYPAGRAPIAVRILALDETLHYAAEAKLALLATLVCLASVAAVALFLPPLLLPETNRTSA